MEFLTTRQHIEMTPAVAGGKPRIAGSRITVQNVVFWHERMGRSVDEIATEHELTLADVHAALAFYFDNRSAIDAAIEHDRELVSSLKQRTPSKLAEKLLRKSA